MNNFRQRLFHKLAHIHGIDIRFIDVVEYGINLSGSFNFSYASKLRIYASYENSKSNTQSNP
ncbi:hypothetical protein SDC9_67275 [bioreactor metagenome]|uniref:Uncharacterized protein n=1 Tax=bioreactor metagenome TaxID=1076179 RepID=A0A644XY71_9ZZZZ